MITCNSCRYYKKGYCEHWDDKFSQTNLFHTLFPIIPCRDYEGFVLTIAEIRKEYWLWVKKKNNNKIPQFINFIDYLKKKYEK